MAILPFLAMYFMVLKGFVYTKSVDIYAFRLAFSSKSHCILHQKHLAFCTKTHRILHQNARHLAPKRTPFSTK